MTRFTFLIVGYVLSVLVECPVLLFGLSPKHSLAVKLFASFWLTACTYPIVILVMPVLIPGPYYILVSEVFAAVAECALFAELFRGRWFWRDMVAIIGANVASFVVGLFLLGA